MNVESLETTLERAGKRIVELEGEIKGLKEQLLVADQAYEALGTKYEVLSTKHQQLYVLHLNS